MPTLTKVLTQDDITSRRGQSRMDLGDYRAIIDQVQRENGVGGLVLLDDNESKRTEKRRLSIAAKQQGVKLIWRKADDGNLRFVLSSPEVAPPDARKRRSKKTETAD